jgi:uncharacterized protein (DUF302 family)
MENLGLRRTVDASFGEVVDRVTEALKKEGFGVLTDIDVEATLRSKLGVEFGPYRILGACNPPLAHRALQAEPSIGLMLPCNVVIRPVEGGVEVSMFDPFSFAAESSSETIREVASEAGQRLRRALDAV